MPLYDELMSAGLPSAQAFIIAGAITGGGGAPTEQATREALIQCGLDSNAAGVLANRLLAGAVGSGTITPTGLSANRTITAADNDAQFYCTTALTITIPAGLSPRPSFVVDAPPTGNVSIAVSGGAQINGATTTLTRSRSANQAGIAVLAHQDADSYGVSGS